MDELSLRAHRRGVSGLQDTPPSHPPRPRPSPRTAHPAASRRDWRRGGRTSAFIVAALWCALSACSSAHKVDVAPQALGELTRFHETRNALVHYQGQDTEVRPEHDPRLSLTLSCTSPVDATLPCTQQLAAPLEKVQWTGQGDSAQVHLTLDDDRPMMIAGDRVRAATLEFDNGLLDGPTWGAGFAILGPSGAGGILMQYIPAQWVALELGALPAVRGAVSFGARVRPWAWWVFRPFLGGTVYGGGDEDRPHNGVSIRAGTDIELSEGRWMITLEVDVVHPLGGETFLFLEGEWIPWGGGAFTYFWD